MSKYLSRDEILKNFETYENDDAGNISDDEEDDYLEINRESEDNDDQEDDEINCAGVPKSESKMSFQSFSIEKDKSSSLKEETISSNVPKSESNMSFQSFSMKKDTSPSLEEETNYSNAPKSESILPFQNNEKEKPQTSSSISTSMFFHPPSITPSKKMTQSVSNFIRNSANRSSCKKVSVASKAIKNKALNFKAKILPKKAEKICNDTKFYGKLTKAMLSKNIAPYSWNKEPELESFVPLKFKGTKLSSHRGIFYQKM
jgi:hypothetical protein